VDVAHAYTSARVNRDSLALLGGSRGLLIGKLRGDGEPAASDALIDSLSRPNSKAWGRGGRGGRGLFGWAFSLCVYSFSLFVKGQNTPLPPLPHYSVDLLARMTLFLDPGEAPKTGLGVGDMRSG
jgi:hypothetical protein